MMNAMLNTWRADVLDRARRRNYLIILLCIAVLTVLFFPSNDDGYATVLIGGYRGIYNAHWVGASLAILCVAFLPIICFYLVKNAVEGDRNRQVGELIGATPVSKSTYLLGKWLSNLSLLCGIILVMSFSAIFVQLWHGESYQIDLAALWLPQLLFVVPMMMVISAAALFFESFAVLRGGFGNVVYFFLYMGLILFAIDGDVGIGGIIEQMRTDVLVHDPNADGSVNIGANPGSDNLSGGIATFEWQGMEYGVHAVKSLLIYSALTAVLLMAAILSFDRFKRATIQSSVKQSGAGIARLGAKVLNPLGRAFESLCAPWSFTRLVRQECLLLIRGGSVWWYLILAGLGFAQLVAPFENVLLGIVPATWLLCVLMFSPMGLREMHQGADQLVFSCLSPLKKQFPAMVVAGFLVALFVVSPAILRLLFEGAWFSVLMLLVGALFISSLASACGALTRTSRTFEVLFTALWYIGPLQKTAALDFVGVVPEASQQANAPMDFLMISILLLVGAAVGRKLQMSR